jgi:hypothetical protein
LPGLLYGASGKGVEMDVWFLTRDGESLCGTLVRSYKAVEGDMRYIIRCNGTDYRCRKNSEDMFVELVL